MIPVLTYLKGFKTYSTNRYYYVPQKCRIIAYNQEVLCEFVPVAVSGEIDQHSRVDLINQSILTQCSCKSRLYISMGLYNVIDYFSLHKINRGCFLSGS